MKWNVTIWKYRFLEWWNGAYRNRVILALLSLIFFFSLIIPFIITLSRSTTINYEGQTTLNLQTRFNAETIKCEENITEKGTVSCRRGPVVIAATDNFVRKLLEYDANKFTNDARSSLNVPIKVSDLKQNTHLANVYRSGWGLLPDLVNWFYNNVPWGIEILTFEKISIVGDSPPPWVPDYSLRGMPMGRLWGKNLMSVKVLLQTILSDVENEIADFFARKGNNPLRNKLDSLKNYLFTTYTTYKMAWYANDESTSYHYGGWVESRRFRERINKTVTWNYLTNRFGNINKKEITIPKVYNREVAYSYLDEIYEKQLALVGKTTLDKNEDKTKLSYLDLFVLANDIKKLSTTSSFAIKNENNNWIFDGIDTYSNVEKELTLFQLKNSDLFTQFKTIEIFLPQSNQKKAIGQLTRNDVNEAMRVANGRINRLIDSTISFNGYLTSWIQQYFLKFIIPILWTNDENFKVADFDFSKINYDELIATYNEEKVKKPLWASLAIKYSEFEDDNFETSKKVTIGLQDKLSHLDYFNQMRMFLTRDWLPLTLNNSLFTQSFHGKQQTSFNNHNLIFKELALLNAMGANPYVLDEDKQISNHIKVDTGLVNALQKVLRMDEDVVMGHLSSYSERSIIWGYMDANADYDYLKLTNRDGTSRLVKITTQDDLDKNYNCIVTDESCNEQDRHSLMSNEYINNKQINEQNIDGVPSRTLLSKITSSDNKNIALKKSRKLWMTDYALIADYANAVVGVGDYAVAFFNSHSQKEKPLVVSEQRKHDAEIKNNEWHILNSNGDIIAYAGWWFYSRNNDNKLYFKVLEQSWINK
ncbi:hypothetical protein [Spiroplasma endosymbiont of Nephrotoma flavescens]|uniref:hypothetical protein n=1 Tax=Spiroplasma endosymbiont of Nephrotoma flavescens TaxID=3066302 RepID=UPI00313E7949